MHMSFTEYTRFTNHGREVHVGDSGRPHYDLLLYGISRRLQGLFGFCDPVGNLQLQLITNGPVHLIWYLSGKTG